MNPTLRKPDWEAIGFDGRATAPPTLFLRYFQWGGKIGCRRIRGRLARGSTCANPCSFCDYRRARNTCFPALHNSPQDAMESGTFFPYYLYLNRIRAFPIRPDALY